MRLFFDSLENRKVSMSKKIVNFSSVQFNYVFDFFHKKQAFFKHVKLRHFDQVIVRNRHFSLIEPFRNRWLDILVKIIWHGYRIAATFKESILDYQNTNVSEWARKRANKLENFFYQNQWEMKWVREWVFICANPYFVYMRTLFFQMDFPLQPARPGHAMQSPANSFKSYKMLPKFLNKLCG